jgi:uncharacterized oxidoreductase
MERHSPQDLEDLTKRIFMACGVPEEEATIVANQLVESNIVGLDSHGVIRIPLYVRWISEGTIVPGAPISIIRELDTMAIIDCGGNFGQVGGLRAMDLAISKAKQHGLSCVVTRACRHVGRLGYFTQMAAEEGMFALAAVNSSKYGHTVVPFGGLEGRFAPNPISYAVPAPGSPLVTDMTMSTSSEGKVRVYRNRGEKLPEGWMIDARGQACVEPEAFYDDPRGWLLPVGGSLGYKGSALLLLCEILGGAMAGEAITDERPDGTNGVCFLVIKISDLTPLAKFCDLMGQMIEYVKSAPPAQGFSEVLVPGELELRTKVERERSGIPLDGVTWGQILEVAAELGVEGGPV